MLGRQTLMKSPMSSHQQQSSLMNFNTSSNSSVSSAAGMSQTLNTAVSPIDEKSIKDIIQILNKCIDKTKNLNEFSQIIQVDNIGLSFYFKNIKIRDLLIRKKYFNRFSIY